MVSSSSGCIASSCCIVSSGCTGSLKTFTVTVNSMAYRSPVVWVARRPQAKQPGAGQGRGVRQIAARPARALRIFSTRTRACRLLPVHAN